MKSMVTAGRRLQHQMQGTDQGKLKAKVARQSRECSCRGNYSPLMNRYKSATCSRQVQHLNHYLQKVAPVQQPSGRCNLLAHDQGSQPSSPGLVSALQ